jgi:hypothetical protein
MLNSLPALPSVIFLQMISGKVVVVGTDFEVSSRQQIL